MTLIPNQTKVLYIFPHALSDRQKAFPGLRGSTVFLPRYRSSCSCSGNFLDSAPGNSNDNKRVENGSLRAPGPREEEKIGMDHTSSMTRVENVGVITTYPICLSGKSA
jgi:hypothetical protein